MANRYGWSYRNVGGRLEGYLARSKVLLPDASELVRKDRIEELERNLNTTKEDIKELRQVIRVLINENKLKVDGRTRDISILP